MEFPQLLVATLQAKTREHVHPLAGAAITVAVVAPTVRATIVPDTVAAPAVVIIVSAIYGNTTRACCGCSTSITSTNTKCIQILFTSQISADQESLTSLAPTMITSSNYPTVNFSKIKGKQNFIENNNKDIPFNTASFLLLPQKREKNTIPH